MSRMRRRIAKHLTTANFGKWITAFLLKIAIHQFVNKILGFHCDKVSFFLSLGNCAA
jgi:hypothetical protein